MLSSLTALRASATVLDLSSSLEPSPEPNAIRQESNITGDCSLLSRDCAMRICDCLKLFRALL